MNDTPAAANQALALLADPARLAALARAALLDSPPVATFDRLTGLVRRVLGVPISLMTLVAADRQFFESCPGLPEPWATERQAPLSLSFCQHVVAGDAPLVVGDARLDPAWRDNAAVAAWGLVAYAGVPLRGSDGLVIGALAAIDGAARTWTADDLVTLGDLAAAVMTEVELRAALLERDRREEQLSALQAVTAALSAVRSVEEVVSVVVNDGCLALGAAGAAVRLRSPDGCWLMRVEVPGSALSTLVGGGPMAVAGPALAAQVARTGEAIWLESPEQWLRRHPASFEASLAEGYQALALLPLRGGEQVIGILGLRFARPQRFDLASRAALLTLAQLAGHAVERARLYDAERDRARIAEELAVVRQEQIEETTALAQVTAPMGSALDPERLYALILEQAARVLRFDFGVVTRFVDGWATVVAYLGEPCPPVGTRLFPAEGGIGRWLPDPAAPLNYLEDTAVVPSWRDFPPWLGADRRRSMISFPLLADGALLGYFSVSSRVPHAYSARDLRLAGLFAERAGQALRNAQLYAAEQERARSAEELVQMRDDFVASVSHELRTPLTVIIGYGELLGARWDDFSEPQRRERLGSIVASANRQLRLVEDLLLATRLDNGTEDLRLAPVYLAELLARVAAETAVTFRGQRVTLDGPDAMRLTSDADYLQRIVTNLASNAAKYSPEGASIAISWARERKTWVAVRVRDQGPGVPEAGRGRLFARFGRLDNSRSRGGHVGTGLGLYLSRRLAMSLGGTLDLESTGPTGSTFVLHVPLDAG